MHWMKVESCFLLCSSFQRIDVFTTLQFRQTKINQGLKRAADANVYLHNFIDVLYIPKSKFVLFMQTKWQAVMEVYSCLFFCAVPLDQRVRL